MRRNPARTEALRLHQAAVDRIIFLAIKRRECERELRDLGETAKKIAIWMPASDFVFGKTVPHRG